MAVLYNGAHEIMLPLEALRDPRAVFATGNLSTVQKLALMQVERPAQLETGTRGHIIAWHGTTEHSATAILRDGLSAKPALKWQVNVISPRDGVWDPRKEDVSDAVFAAFTAEEAGVFAMQRCAYLQAKPGTYIPSRWEGFPRVLKLANAPIVANAKPALLKLTLPPSFSFLGNDNTQLLLREVPARYIKQVAVRD
jgi:hypothetical protein